MDNESAETVPKEDYEALKLELKEKERALAEQAGQLTILREKANECFFLKNYHFWTLIVTALTLLAISYFAWDSHKIQSTLQSIEQARQNEKFCNDLEIYFDIKPSPSNKLEEAIYNLKLLNNSSYIFESLKTKAELLFENQQTREIEKEIIFTFPKMNLIPSNEPICLRENPELSNTFRTNISEAKSKFTLNYNPKCIHFLFEWHVKTENVEHPKIHKRKYFLIQECH